MPIVPIIAFCFGLLLGAKDGQNPEQKKFNGADVKTQGRLHIENGIVYERYAPSNKD